MSEPTVEMEEITPERAQELLDRNKRNRHIRGSIVEQYARDMTNGNWYNVGDTIKISVDGDLLDGQHRLRAIILSETTQKMMVVSGLEPETQNVMDSGARRTLADALNFSGYHNVTTLAAVARFGIAMDKGMGARFGGLGRQAGISNSEALEWVERNPTILPAVQLSAARWAKYIDAPPTALAYAWWKLSEIDPEKAHEFFEGMATMSTSGQGDPRVALMRLLQRVRTDRVRLSHSMALSAIYRAWNAWRKGDSMNAMRTEVNGEPVAIPKPR